MISTSLVAVLPLVGLARAHAAIWHPSMWGFNVTATNSPQYGDRDNRPQAPLKGLPFDQWWFHGHLDQPPHPEDVMELPAGGKVTTELSCDKDATSYWPSGPGGDRQNGNDPCPGPPSVRIHTNGLDDLGGCALAIAYKSDVAQVQPEDLVVFSVNQRCVWDRFTDFYVPANMPACPNDKCTCAWFWQHREDAGGDEIYMNGFQCKVTGATATTPIPQGQVAVDCSDDSSKCVKGAKQPFYWDQAERNNVFNNIYKPPLYMNSFGFYDGAQNDIWDTVTTAKNTSSSSSSSAAATSTSASVASTSVAAEATTSSTPAAEPTSSAATSSTPAAEPASTSIPTQGASTSHAVTTSAQVTSSTPAAKQAAAQTSEPASSSSSEASPTKSKSNQGQRTCRPKKKRSARALNNAARHRSRRSRAL